MRSSGPKRSSAQGRISRTASRRTSSGTCQVQDQRPSSISSRNAPSVSSSSSGMAGRTRSSAPESCELGVERVVVAPQQADRIGREARDLREPSADRRARPRRTHPGRRAARLRGGPPEPSRRAPTASRGSGGAPTEGTRRRRSRRANGIRVASPRTSGNDRFSAGLLDELAEHRRARGRDPRARSLPRAAAARAAPYRRRPRARGHASSSSEASSVDRAGHRLVGDRPRPVVVVGRAVEPDGLAHDVGGYDFGMSLVGSTNGRLATVTGTRPREALGLERRPGRLPSDRHPRVADVPLEPGRPRAGRDLPQTRVALDQRPEVVQRALVGHRLAADLDADQLAVEQVAVADLLQAAAAEEVGALVPLDEPLEPAHVQRRVLDPDVRAVVEDARLDPRASLGAITRIPYGSPAWKTRSNSWSPRLVSWR